MRKVKIIFVVFMIALYACESHQPNGEGKPNDHREGQLQKEREIQPAKVESEYFQQVAGWFDQETIIYIRNMSQGAEMILYNLYNGQAQTFFRANAPIVQIIPNKDLELFFIQTTPSNYEAQIIVINRNAEIVYEKSFSSFDVFMKWNPYQVNQFFLTTFYEDWSYDTYMIDVNAGEEKKNIIPVPFIEWAGPNQVAYIDWNNEEPELSASLYTMDIEEQTKELISNDVIGHAHSQSYTIFLKEDVMAVAHGVLAVNHNEMDEIQFELNVPLVSQYSQWLFPYYEINDVDQLFYTFLPVDIIDERPSFHLKRIDLEAKSESTVIENIANEPIELSPNGEFLLYGYRLEKLIDLKNEKIISIIDER